MKSSDTIITGEHKGRSKESTTQILANQVETSHSEAPRKQKHRRIPIPLIQKEQQFRVNSDGSAVVVAEEISDVCLWKCVYAIHDLLHEGGREAEKAVAILRELIKVALSG